MLRKNGVDEACLQRQKKSTSVFARSGFHFYAYLIKFQTDYYNHSTLR